jgi:hypothetical protein
MMMEEEFAQSEQLRTTYSGIGAMPEAVEIAQALFADQNARGIIRLKEHARIEKVELVETNEFIRDIRALFLPVD